MKQSLSILFVLFSALHADAPFVMTNESASQENVETFTTTDREFESLFEIVDMEETSSLIQEEELIAHDPAIPLVEASSAEPTLEKTLPREEVAAVENKQVTTLLEPPSQLVKQAAHAINIQFSQVFAGSPIIYSLLLLLSTLTLFIWLYTQIHLRNLTHIPAHITSSLQNRLTSNQYDEALSFCLENNNLFCKMLGAGILVRKQGLQLVADSMKSEGKRATIKFWQKLSLLNEIAIIAPMLGLLGTVLGMFYAFYDLNRSVESVSNLFNGLGISVGTTLAGLIVAILAMMLHSIAKYRLVRKLAAIEHQVQSFAHLIDNKM